MKSSIEENAFYIISHDISSYTCKTVAFIIYHTIRAVTIAEFPRW